MATIVPILIQGIAMASTESILKKALVLNLNLMIYLGFLHHKRLSNVAARLE